MAEMSVDFRFKTTRERGLQQSMHKSFASVVAVPSWSISLAISVFASSFCSIALIFQNLLSLVAPQNPLRFIVFMQGNPSHKPLDADNGNAKLKLLGMTHHETGLDFLHVPSS